MFDGFLAIVVFFLLRAYWKSRGEIASLREELERIDGRLDTLFDRVRPTSSKAAADVAPSPHSPPAPAPAPTPAPASTPAPATRSVGRPSSVRSADRTVPSPERPPRIDDPFDRAASWVKDRLSGVGWTVVVGVIVLFFGMAFLVKYAIDRDLVSVQLRLLGAAAAGLGMVAFGYRARRGRPLFGLSLQGGGIGVLYLTVFAAFRLYDLLPAALALFLLVALVGASAALALVQGSRVLMTLASTGGFLAPILASTGSDNHVALFSYYLVLNAGILAVAWFRAWRVLNLVGFGFTFAIATLWGALRYRPELFASTEPFLIAFFVLYVAISVLFAIRQKPDLKGLVDGTLVFGVPLAVSVLQAALVRDLDNGLAWSAFGLGLFYLVLARAVASAGGKALEALAESFLATGMVFATLAVPFAFDELTTSVLWALEGAAIVWIGIRQNRVGARLFASALQVGAGVVFLTAPLDSAAHALLNGTFLGTVVITVAALITGFQFERARARDRGRLLEVETAFPVALLAWGLLWWLGGSLHEIDRFARDDDALGWILLLFAATAALASALGRELAWRALGRVALGLLPALGVSFLVATVVSSHPLQALAGPGWLVAGSSHALVLWLERGRDRRLWHAGGLWLGTVLAAWEASYQVAERIPTPETWSFAVLGVVPAVVVLLVSRFVRSEAYRTWGTVPIVALSLSWLAAANVSMNGASAPLPFVPLLNPLDVAAVIVLAAAYAAERGARVWLVSLGLAQAAGRWILAGAGYFWLHGILVRTVHHWGDVPFEADALFASTLVQMSVAILWAVTGLVGMVNGTRRGLRPVWILGASFMGAVVAKLFLVDLSQAETVARIVSFIAVGTLLLVVGYLSPAPPSAVGAEARSSG